MQLPRFDIEALLKRVLVWIDSEVDQAVAYLGSEHRGRAALLGGELLAIDKSYVRVKRAAGEADRSGPKFVARRSGRKGNRLQQKKFFGRFMVYPYALRTRKSAGLMMRKLSVTESQKTAQFFGTSSRRKCRTDRQKSL